MKIKIALALSLLLFELSYAQSGHGFSFDNYNSLYALTINPAFSVESKAKWHVNGFSYSNINFTNVGEIDPINFTYLSTPNGFDGIDYGSNFPQDEVPNNMHTERDWLLPSVIYKFNDQISAGLVLRSRALTNYTGFNGALLEIVNLGEATNSTVETYPNMPFNFTNTSHYWNEIGLNVAVSVINTDDHIIKLGGTAKLLQGQGAVNLTATNFQSSLNSSNQLTISTGEVEYLNTFTQQSEIESNLFGGPFQNFANSTSDSGNFGFDAGLVWEFRASGTNRLERGLSESAVNLYKVKLSASILDLGSITYSKDPNDERLSVLNDTYTINGLNNIALSEFPENNLIQVLQQNSVNESVSRAQPRGEVKVALPTALNVNVDYLVNNDNNIYVNANFVQPVRKNEDDFSNQRMQLLTVTPRFEKPNWSIYVPISASFENSDFALGLGARYKYVTAGIAIPELGGVSFIYFGFNAPLVKL
jgi:hypothetical protein